MCLEATDIYLHLFHDGVYGGSEASQADSSEKRDRDPGIGSISWWKTIPRSARKFRRDALLRFFDDSHFDLPEQRHDLLRLVSLG
jgi:hypothetical protein